MRLLWLKMYTPIVDSDDDDAPSGVQELYELDADDLSEPDDAPEPSLVAPSPTLSVRQPPVATPTIGREKSVPQSPRELRFGHSVPTSEWEAS